MGRASCRVRHGDTCVMHDASRVVRHTCRPPRSPPPPSPPPQVTMDDDCNYRFEFGAAVAADAGRYVCVATNRLGAERCSVSLVVKATEGVDNVSDFRSVLRKSKWVAR